MQRPYFDRVIAPKGLAPQYESEPPKIVGANPLEQTVFEKCTVTSLIGIATELSARSGYTMKRVPEEPVIVLDTDVLRSEFSDGQAGATMYRRAYVCREAGDMEIAHLISHELAHAFSFTALTVITEPKQRRIKETRSGFEVRRFDKPLLFVGLNEAVTEMVATVYRHMFTMRTDLLDEEESERLVSTHAYWHQIHLIESLTDILSETFDDYVRTDLIDDYFEGTFKTVRASERLFPGSARLLAHMGSKPEDAIRVARALGLDEVLSDFEDLPTPS